jgi:hypothetical protein
MKDLPCCAHQEAYKLDAGYSIISKSALSGGIGKNGFIIPIVREAATVKEQQLGLGRPPFPCRFPSKCFVSWFC